ncbi:guanylate cyclase [Actinoplanes sp. NBRC 103695]|nr:guanylate cyclase [Actinoplanes sp. NBRC 103695]
MVVVLFLDLVGWTRLAEQVDPEPLQLMLEQYYDICSVTVGQHGGVVEKFIGDAVMAVFGATRADEDDALRALRAAARIRAGVAGLVTPGTTGPPRIHCGLAAGEALVTRSPRAGMRVVGDVVNLAARLQSAAAAGEIVVNETMSRLVRGYVRLNPVAPLSLKGKAAPVPAFLVSGPVPDSTPAAQDGPMVDRDDERGRIQDAYRQVVRDGRARALVVLGPPGIGKSRLVREALAGLGAVTVVAGVCPPRGPDGDHAALADVLEAVARTSGAARALLDADRRMTAVLDGLRGGRDTAGPGAGVEEVARLARELLAAATERPLVVVWDNLEWAGPSLLGLLGDTVAALADRPLLTICAGRPELLAVSTGRPGNNRPGGPAVDSGTAWLLAGETLDVGALTPDDCQRLAGMLTGISAEVQAHDLADLDRAIVQSAGNPLLLRLLVESAGDLAAGTVPPTVTAVVGALLDRLPGPARDLLGPASVIGSVFDETGLGLLGVPAPAAVLDDLVTRQVIRPDGAGRYVFVQQPMHEVAYGRLEKSQRLAWHRELAERGVSPALHLEAALRLLAAIRPDDPGMGELAAAAAGSLLREGTAVLRQRDLPTATGLLDRAVRHAADGPDRAVAAIRLSDTLLLMGDTRRAMEVVAAVARDTADPGVRDACTAQLRLLDVRLGNRPDSLGRTHTDNGPDSLGRTHTERGPDETQGPLARTRLAQVRMLVHLEQGRFGAAEHACLSGLAEARAMDDSYEQDRLLVALCEIRQWAPTRLADQLVSCAELAARFAGDRVLLVPVLAARARCLALLGDGPGARAALAEAEVAVAELRLHMGRVLIDQVAGLAAALDGTHLRAARLYRRAADALDRAGHTPVALTLRVQAVREHPVRDGELAALLGRMSEMDFRGRLLSLSVAARTGAAPPEGVEQLLAVTDDPGLRGDVLFDLARAYRKRGDATQAGRLAAAATDSYAVIGATRPMEAVRAWI